MYGVLLHVLILQLSHQLDEMGFYFSLAIFTWLLPFFMFLFFLRIESIDKMESDFKNCHMFLVTILNKAVCRGSFPHCKSSTASNCMTRKYLVLLTVYVLFSFTVESLALSLMAGFEQC